MGPGEAQCPQEEEGWGRGQCPRGNVPPDTGSEGGVLSWDNSRGTQEEREPLRHSGPRCGSPLLHRLPQSWLPGGPGSAPVQHGHMSRVAVHFQGGFLGVCVPLSGLRPGLGCANPATGHATVGTEWPEQRSACLPALSDALILPGEAALGPAPLGDLVRGGRALSVGSPESRVG